MGHKTGRNERCPCGSGKKYKKCCLDKDKEQARAVGNPPVQQASAPTELEALMLAGYELSMAGREAEACDRWLVLWDAIRSRFQPHMRTCESAQSIFVGSQFISNWLYDFGDALHNAALDDSRYAEHGVSFREQALAQFPDEDELILLNLRAELGESLYMAGRPADGERVLTQLIDDYPEHAIGYVYLAQVLGEGCRPSDPPMDRPRAIELLEHAAARPVHDGADWDLEARLDDLRRHADNRSTNASHR